MLHVTLDFGALSWLNLVPNGLLAIDQSPYVIEHAEFVRACIANTSEYEMIEFRNRNFFDFPTNGKQYDLIRLIGIAYHLTDIIGFFLRVSN